ncbi:BlaI/MecI/CopY family transcriptional regulator [Porphyromonadaceae bacterium]
MERLTQSEEEVMRIIWNVGEGTIKDYHEQLEEPRMPYTTMAYFVDNLRKKGYVKIRRIGITKLCYPLIDEEEYKRHSLSNVVDMHFRSSYKDVVSFFAKDQKISTDELKEIIRIIESGEGE